VLLYIQSEVLNEAYKLNHSMIYNGQIYYVKSLYVNLQITFVIECEEVNEKEV
jgi:hypothetical protein